MKILFEDREIVVCIKPYGVISQSSETGNDMVKMLSEKLNSDIYPVHRLDRETGGVMVYAKNSQSAARLSKDIAERKMQKKYLAVVHNDITPERAELTDLLFRDSKKNKSYVVKRPRKGVKEAVLCYEKLKSANTEYGVASLVKVTLKTGRTHQIRVQFASRGYPLVGDKRYGGKDSAPNLGLWAFSLKFNHPATGKEMEFDAMPENEVVFENIL